MRVSAILVISNKSVSTLTGGDFVPGQGRPLAGVPLSCVEILGQSVLDRVVSHLHKEGVKKITVVAEPGFVSSASTRGVQIMITSRSSDRWSTAEQALTRHARHGAEAVLVSELGAYIEFDLNEILRFHRDQGKAITQLHDSRGPLDFWIVDASSIRPTRTGCTLPFSEYETLSTVPFPVMGYVNRLADGRDLRRLVMDAFLMRCALRPCGREVRPGVWLDDGAQSHNSARIVAPAYLGRSVRVAASAVVTRFSNVEHHCFVGSGTMVHAASILPHTVLGKGLEVSNAVVDGNEFVDLGRNLTVRIDDPSLIRDASPGAWRIPRYEAEAASSLDNRSATSEIECSRYLSRAVVLVSEVFKGEL